MNEEKPIIHILHDSTGWSFSCRYCEVFSGKRTTESRVKKEAARHEKQKGHLVLVSKVEAMNA